MEKGPPREPNEADRVGRRTSKEMDGAFARSAEAEPNELCEDVVVEAVEKMEQAVLQAEVLCATERLQEM